MKNYHYHFGIHSNIPECCVNFYIEKKEQGIISVGTIYRPEYFENLDKFLNIRYVPCDECHEKILAGTYIPNKIHSCRLEPNDECVKFREVL